MRVIVLFLFALSLLPAAGAADTCVVGTCAGEVERREHRPGGCEGSAGTREGWALHGADRRLEAAWVCRSTNSGHGYYETTEGWEVSATGVVPGGATVEWTDGHKGCDLRARAAGSDWQDAGCPAGRPPPDPRPFTQP